MIHSYPSIFAIGHRALAQLLEDPVVVQEKVDGSQISFGLFYSQERSQFELHVRSKGAELNLAAPEKMFLKAIESIHNLDMYLTPGWTYRGEYLAKPHHNALAYDRVPRKHIVIYDIMEQGQESYLDPDQVRDRADTLGLETVPLLHHGFVSSAEQFRAMLDRESMLGGQKIEGVVVKNYKKFGPDKKVLMGKFVSEQFKEVHAKVWGETNPNQGDILERLGAKYRNSARWDKAVIHLREQGKIEDSMRDLAHLVPAVWPDIEKECKDDIKDELYAWAVDQIRRKSTAGIAEWYKEKLLQRQFETPKHECTEDCADGQCPMLNRSEYPGQ